MPSPSRHRLLQVCGQIAISPASHDQRVYYRTNKTRTGAEMSQKGCGTTGCFAGHAVFMFGDPSAIYHRRENNTIYLPDKEGAYVLDPFEDEVVPYDGWFHLGLSRLSHSTVREEAKKLLGLSEDQAGWLFAAERSIEQLFAGVAYILAHPDVNRDTLDYQIRYVQGI